jgi:glycosyltransferase involved in cell wall biosynthesis
MKPTPSVLFVSYCFPPDAQVGGLRLARFCKYLPEFGFRPIVLTVQEQLYEALDHEFPLNRETHVERTEANATPLQLYRRWHPPSNHANGSVPVRGKRPGFLKRHLFALLGTPDRFWGWYLPAVRAGLRLFRREPIVAMISSGPPWISHLVARRLKRSRPDVRWLADFRDPWALAPTSEEFPGWRKAINRRLEASIVKRADLVICNTDRLSESFRVSYPLPAEHFFTLTNGFDDSPHLATAASPPDHGRLALHLGDIYDGRRIDTFCRALARLWESNRLDSSWKVRFVGGVDAGVAEAALRDLPEAARGRIQFEPRVGWARGQETLRAADVLLLFQGDTVLQVPAKFYEYLQTGKPIFAVAAPGATTDAIEATGAGLWVDPRDPVRIAETFLRVLELPPDVQAEVRHQRESRFHYRALTASLAAQVRAVAR